MASIGELMVLRRSGKRGKKVANFAGDKIEYDQVQNSTPTVARDNILFNSSFRSDYALLPEREVFRDDLGPPPVDTYLFPESIGAASFSAGSVQVSTDVVGRPAGSIIQPDDIAEDAEETNLLFAGVSNLVTTRSDAFTVYFRIRSFRQDPVSGRWDATNKENIIEDSRYVMLVDRSEVNHPADKPRIIYLEKLPQ